eukprot:13767840-Alexandrium_andersonii.AAC.1
MGRLAGCPQNATDHSAVDTGDLGHPQPVKLRRVHRQLEPTKASEDLSIDLVDDGPPAGVRLNHQTGCLGRAQDGRTG